MWKNGISLQKCYLLLKKAALFSNSPTETLIVAKINVRVGTSGSVMVSKLD